MSLSQSDDRITTYEKHKKLTLAVYIYVAVNVVVCSLCVCSGKDSPGSESDGGDSRSETGSGEIQPKKVISDVTKMSESHQSSATTEQIVFTLYHNHITTLPSFVAL